MAPMKTDKCTNVTSHQGSAKTDNSYWRKGAENDGREGLSLCELKEEASSTYRVIWNIDCLVQSAKESGNERH